MRLVDSFETSHSLVAVIRASDGVVLGVNPAFERSTGYRGDQVIGRPAQASGPWPPPDARDRLCRQLRAEGRVERFALAIPGADGGEIAGELSV